MNQDKQNNKNKILKVNKDQMQMILKNKQQN